MIYRELPAPLPKPPVGFFAAVGTPSVFVSKRPNWFQRNFPPFPFVYRDYAKSNRVYGGDHGLFSVLVSCAFTLLVMSVRTWVATAVVALLSTWLILLLCGFFGIFHRKVEIMDWKEP